MTQKKMVLDELRKGDQTYAELNRIFNYQINCAYSVIRDLRNCGHVIQDRYEQGKKSRYKVFTLIE